MTTPHHPTPRPDLSRHVSLRQAARMLTADGIPTSPQWLSRLSMTDPAFPPVWRMGRSIGVDYDLLKPYMEGRPRRARKAKIT